MCELELISTRGENTICLYRISHECALFGVGCVLFFLGDLVLNDENLDEKIMRSSILDSRISHWEKDVNQFSNTTRQKLSKKKIINPHYTNKNSFRILFIDQDQQPN